ncbi:MAG TPA: hypothetical protein PLF40_10345, partial [Kofleriaceae bacterium]|nr:hypothetical protein [Kofleriaceae bacterium]
DRLRQSRDWSTSIDELEKELEGSGTKPEQSERLFELAAIAEEVIPERDRALGLYQRAWKLHPDNLKALSRAREVYAEIGRLEMVGKLGEMELRSPAAAANLAAIVGEALLDSGQKDKALAVLQKALEKTPDSYRVKDALAALSYDPEFWTDEVERLTDEATRFDSAMAARMLLRAARIMRLQEPDNAGLEALLRQVLGHDIDEPSANFMLESLLAAAQRWTDLEAHHDARVQHAADTATKIERCRGFGLQWLQRFKDRERSARFFTQAVTFATSNGAVAMRSSVAMFALLRQTSSERKDWAGLLAIADQLLQRNTAGSDSDEMASEKLFVSSAAGAIGFEHLGDEGVARKYYRIAASVAPQSPAVAEFVEAFGLGTEEAAPAPVPVAVVVNDGSQKAAADDAAEQAAADKAVADKAAADKAVADQAEKAAAEQAAAEQAAAEKAAAEQAASAEKAAAEKAAAEKASAEQAAASKAAADKAAAEAAAAAKPAEAPRTVRSTAAPKFEVPADLDAAMEAARNAESGNDKGIGAWKEVIAKHPTQRGPRRELARILRGNQAWSQLADALRDEEAKATSASTEKAELLRELAEVYGKLSNDNQVIAALTSSLGHAPAQLDVYDQLAAVYESKKRWPDLVKVLGEKAEQISDVDGKVAIHLQIANLYLERFSNQAEAIKAFERVLELDPQNGTAIEHLLSVYEKRRDWEKLIKLKENEIAQTPESERAAKVIEVAKMAATKVKKPEICTHWWEMVVQYEPTHEEALAELYKLYERNKEWDKLADISSKQADSAADDKARADALQRLGILYTEKLENSGKAIDAWQRLLAIDENHRRAQDALKKLYVTEGRWDDLEEFYRSRGKLDEYIRVLEREVEAGSEQHRLSLAMKIATLYRDELQKPDRAMWAFEKVLTLDENNLVAAEALIPLYEASRDPRRLVGVLEIQLKSTDDLNMRQERMKRLAEYNEEKLKEKGAAFQWWLKAHAEDHNAEWIRTEAERLAGETGAWNQLVDAYTASLPKFEHKADALPLMLVMARVIEQEQGDVDRALDVNRQILAIDDANEQAVDALERLYLGKGRYQELLDIYQKKLDLTSDGDVRVAIQSKIGQLYEDEVKDDKKAIAAYQAILDAAGDVPSALNSLDRVYLRNQMWPQLADILSRQLLVTGPDDDKALHLETKYRVGQIRETHLNDAAGALDAYRDILDLDVNHDKARTALERRLATSTDDKHRLAVAGVLEPVYEQLGSWESLVGIHEIQLAAETDTLRKTSLLLRIGELQRANLGNAEKSFDAHARAFAIDPSTDVSKQQIEELAPHIDNGWERVNALFEAAIVKPTIDPSLAHELCGKVATNYEQQLHNSAKAVEFFRKALAQEPEDLAALTALEKIFERDAQYKELLEVYRRRVDISNEPAERLKFLFGIADLQEHRLGAPQEAISAYNEILGQEPDDLRALQALDRLYVGTKQWRDLGDNLSRQLLLVDADDERVTLLVRLAQLRETHLAEGGAAVETYRQVLDIDASNHDAITALERMLSIAEHELTIANILEPIYHARGDWQKQIGVYEIMAKHSYDPARKIELLHKIAELHEVGGDDTSNAFATHARALREDPRNDTTHGQIERLARGLGQWSQAAALYDSIATESSDDDLKVALLTRRAQVQESELRDDKAAVASYERILQTAPQAVDAASAIQAIHERNSDWPALVAALRRKSEILVDINERKALLLRAAQIEEEVIGDHDAAIATYNQVLRIDENDGAAMDALERIYVRLSRWAPLKDIYAKKVELADDPADKKQMLYVLAQVYDRELGDVAKAIETYQGILDIDADELPAIQSLDRLYGQAERWYDLLGNLERQVELADSSGEHVALKYRIGHLWQTRLGDLARAVESYREALELDPSHAETLRALDGLLRGKNEPVMAAKVLEPIYDATGEYAKLIEVLEVMVTHAEDPLTRVELLHRIALLNEQRLGAAEPAFDAYARALKDDAGNNLTLGHIERLAELTNRWPTLAKLYAAEADKSLDVPRQVDLLARLARISEQEVNDVPAAIGTYRRILDVEFDNKPAVLALDRLYTQTQAWPELTEILRREIQLAEDDAEVATLQYRLGATLEHRQGDRKAAVEVYREIISANPTHGETIAALEQMFHAGHHQGQVGAILEPLYETANENEKLHGLFQVQLGGLQGTERQSMYQRLAELAEHRLYDASRASAWWGQAYVEDPRWEAAGEHVERLAKDTGGWEDLVAVYTQALARNADPELQRQILLRMARVYEYEQRDVAKAVETHLRVLEVAPTDADALAALDRLYLGAGMYDDLVEILRRRVEITTDHDEHIE